MPSEQQKGDLGEAFVSEVLNARRMPDKRSGEGEAESYMVSFGDEGHPAWMRVWPGSGGVAIESDFGRLELEGITHVSTRRGRLWLMSPQDGERLVLEVSPTGMWRAGRGVSMKEADMQSEDELRRGGEESSEAERVTLRGRVGALPRFRETPQMKRPIASFPLGVHPDMDTTEWYTVVAFGPWATRLREKGLVVGQEVEVVGYVHERERRARDGNTRRVREIYAAAVRTTLKQPPTK